MQFLLPTGGPLPAGFTGILTTFAHRGIPQAIKAGAPWAGDNCSFSTHFNPDRFLAWLDTMRPYRATCRFIVVPDRPFDAGMTAKLFREWYAALDGWPLAFVAQDGMENAGYLDWPGAIDFTDYCCDELAGDDDWSFGETAEQWKREGLGWSTLFIGGTTEWKLSVNAAALIVEAQRLGKHIHIGRVNSRKRYRAFQILPGSDEFTCDGTAIAYQRDKTIRRWRNDQRQIPLLRGYDSSHLFAWP